MKRLFLIILITILWVPLRGQNGGRGVFTVLKTAGNALTNAWGGFSTAWNRGDASFLFSNPALLGEAAHQTATMNFNTQFTGIWSGNAAYSMKYRNWGQFGLGINFINYGTMDAYDAGGNSEGQVSANESAFLLAWSYPLNKNLSVGATTKVAYSILAGYVGNGMAFDAGIVYSAPDSVWSAGLVMQNAGFMVQHYRDAAREPLPFQVNAALNVKPRHMPFRFNITYHDLQKFDLTYNQYLGGNTLDLNGQPAVSKPASFPDKLARHLALGTELVLGPNFGIMAGYNHQRRKEMAPSERRKVSGYSWGIHFKVSKFNICYSSASYFPGFNTNLFTFSARLSDFRKNAHLRPE